MHPRRRLIGLFAALFATLSITCAIHADGLRQFGAPALEFGVKATLLASASTVFLILTILFDIMTKRMIDTKLGPQANAPTINTEECYA